MKKILIALVCMFSLVLTGCSYERDEGTGEVVKITVSEMQKMIDDKESFAIVFTQTTCENCTKFHTMLDTYILDHKVTLYEIVLDEAPEEDRKAELSQIRKTFAGMNATPSLFYVKEGKKEHEVTTEDEAITKERFDDFVQSYKLDEKK